MKLIKYLFNNHQKADRCIVCNKKINATSCNQMICGDEYCCERNYTVADDMYNV